MLVLLFMLMVLLVIDAIGIAGTCGAFVVINLLRVVFSVPQLNSMLIFQTIGISILMGTVVYLAAELCLIIIKHYGENNE